jgi:cytochrome P450/GMP synthase-like glutamine amidotransferase
LTSVAVFLNWVEVNMLIGILECGQTSPDWIEEHGEMAAPFPPFLHRADPTLNFRVYKAHRGELPQQANECDAWLVTGSPISVYERLPWQGALARFLVDAQQHRPVVGICYGHQLLHDALGGEVTRSSKGWGVGVQTYPVQQRPKWVPQAEAGTSSSALHFIALHQDQVTTPAPGTQVIAGNDFCPLGITTIGERVLTIQAHPEMSTKLARAIYESQRASQGDALTDAAAQSLQNPVDDDLAARWVLAFIQAQGAAAAPHTPSAPDAAPLNGGDLRMTTATSTRPRTQLDLTDPGIWHQAVPTEEFNRLRRESPVAWNERTDGQKGFWAVTRYDDIVAVSGNTSVFSSRNGVISLDDFDDAQNDARRTLLEMDAPQHPTMRMITVPGFMPKAVAALEASVRATATQLIDVVLQSKEVDVVGALAKQLPIFTLCRLLGIPQERREDMIRWSDLLVGSDDPDFIDPAVAAYPEAERRMLPFGHPASLEAFELGLSLARKRRSQGADDIGTRLALGTFDGRTLSDQEFCNYFLMLVVAGNETTRHSISHGIKAFCDHPEQWARFRSGEVDLRVAADEVFRWASPVHFVRRIATTDTELAGAHIAKGDKVAMYFASGNRDEAHFHQPHQFKIDRTPNQHMAFGRGGPHFCLGNHVAKLQVSILLQELAKRVSSMALTGPADRLRSNHVHGIKRLPVAFTPA